MSDSSLSKKSASKDSGKCQECFEVSGVFVFAGLHAAKPGPARLGESTVSPPQATEIQLSRDFRDGFTPKAVLVECCWVGSVLNAVLK